MDMRSRPPAVRPALCVIIIVLLLAGCQSRPARRVAISSQSSLLAVDVLYPFPMSRDPALVQVFFVRGPVDRGFLPELIPATFVKGSRAYLLDPEPGIYGVAAVSSRVAPPKRSRAVAGGVTGTVLTEEIGHVMVFPRSLVERTRVQVRPGRVSFIGALRVQRGSRINAASGPIDKLQTRIAERVRPGVTKEGGLSGMLSMTWTVDLDTTRLSSRSVDRRRFLESARADFGTSAWATVIARTDPRAQTLADVPARTPTSHPTAEAPPDPRPQIAAGSEPRAATSPVAVTETVAAPVAEPRPLVQTTEPVPSSEPSVRVEPKNAPAPEGEAGEVRSSTQPVIAALLVPEPPADEMPVAEETEVAMLVPMKAPPEPKPEPAAPKRRFTGVPAGHPLSQIEFGMHHGRVREILGEPDLWKKRMTSKVWIPFYSGPDARLVDFYYDGMGRVVFTLESGTLEVFDVVPDPVVR